MLRLPLLLLAYATTACGAAPEATPGMPGQPALLIAAVTVIDLERDLQQKRWVVIRDGRIAAVEDDAPGDIGDVLVIDAQGKFLIPGLAEMHAHVPSPRQGASMRDRVMFLYLAAGVTTARGMLGHPSHLELRDAIQAYDALGPRLVTSGPSLNGNSVSSPDQARRMVREQSSAGYDFLKIHPGLTAAEFDAMADEAGKTGLRFAGHVSLAVGLERALAAGQATIDHLDSYMQALVPAATAYEDEANGFFGAGLGTLADRTRIAWAARATAAAGTWNVPTQSLIENVMLPPDAATLTQRPEMAFMPAGTVAGWRERKESMWSSPRFDAADAMQFVNVRRALILALHDAGAGLLLGSDAPQIFNVPGFAAHRELAALVAAGLTPREALLTGTLNPAKFFGATDNYGAIRTGLEADAILLEADPTADIANIGKIAAVIARGRWMPRAWLDDRLARYSR